MMKTWLYRQDQVSNDSLSIYEDCAARPLGPFLLVYIDCDDILEVVSGQTSAVGDIFARLVMPVI